MSEKIKFIEEVKIKKELESDKKQLQSFHTDPIKANLAKFIKFKNKNLKDLF